MNAIHIPGVLRRPVAILALLLPAPAAPGADEGAGEVYVVTAPPGAIVSCDGAVRGAAPLTITGLAPGEHLLVARRQDYREARRTVSVRAGQRMAAELSLEPVTGLVLMQSEPPGAEVRIEGADRGRTPLLVTDLTPGTYRVQLSHAGYLPKEIDLRVQDRIPMRIRESLTSDSATLALSSHPPGASVVLNGMAAGTTPCTLDRIPGGESTLELVLEGFQPYRQALNLAAGETAELTAVLDPVPARLTLVSLPPAARAYLDDQFRGRTPLTIEALAPGAYRVRIEQEGYEPAARTVQLGRAENAVEEFRLERNSGLFELTTEPAGVRVFLDGRDIGVTTAREGQTDRVSEPLRLDLLSEGEHTLQLSKKGYFSRERTVEITRSETVTVHETLKKRFIPDVEVRTDTDVYRGVLIEVDPEGNVKLEIRPGIFRTVPAAEIRSRKPLRDENP